MLQCKKGSLCADQAKFSWHPCRLSMSNLSPFTSSDPNITANGLVYSSQMHALTDEFIKSMIRKHLPEDQTIPIVLGKGLWKLSMALLTITRSLWLFWIGFPLFGAVNYCGGIECLSKKLMEQGCAVIVTPIAPLSTNWEHACELYAMPTHGK